MSRVHPGWAALAEAAIPPGERLEVPVDREDLESLVADTLAAMDRPVAWGVRAAMVAFDLLAVLRHGRRFHRLPPPRRAAWVQAWNEAHLPLARLALRLLLTFVRPAHFRRRAVQLALGYPVDRLAGSRPEEPLPWPVQGVVEDLESDAEVRCQVVVVGTGAGGAVVAAELAERGVDVVLVEAGRAGPQAGPPDPVRAFLTRYREGGTTIALGRPPIPIPLGEGVGGTTAINSGTCFRMPARVRERWREAGLEVDDLEARYARVEEVIGVRPVPETCLGGSSLVVRRGAEALGLSHGPLHRNIRGCAASGVCVFGCPRQAKQSTDLTWVPRALRAGARLYTGMRVGEVLRERGRATGVVAAASGGGPRLTVRAEAVVLACGTVGDVPLLRRAGVRSRHLGRHMTIHPAGKVAALMPEPVEGWADTPQGYMVDSLADQGILLEGAFVPPEYASVALPFAGRAHTAVMERFPRLAMFGAMVSDRPRGRVRVAPGGRPIMTYSIHRDDLRRLLDGLGLVVRIFFAAGAERVYLPVAGVEEQVREAEALAALRAVRDPWAVELVAFHPLGTARMAIRAREGVVRPDFACWEVPGLHVVDGAIIPGSLGVNPQVTIMALALRAAETLADGLGR